VCILFSIINQVNNLIFCAMFQDHKFSLHPLINIFLPHWICDGRIDIVYCSLIYAWSYIVYIGMHSKWNVLLCYEKQEKCEVFYCVMKNKEKCEKHLKCTRAGTWVPSMADLRQPGGQISYRQHRRVSSCLGLTCVFKCLVWAIFKILFFYLSLSFRVISFYGRLLTSTQVLWASVLVYYFTFFGNWTISTLVVTFLLSVCLSNQPFSERHKCHYLCFCASDFTKPRGLASLTLFLSFIISSI